MIVQVKERWGGETLAKSYTANALNQYTSIANPDAVGLRGSATNTATVTVNGNAALSDNVASDTVPWHYALLADNANGPDYTFANIMAVVNPPGTNTPDVVESTSGSVYAPPRAEALAYDDDGNLLSDGRWHYTWNGENRLICAEEQVCPTNRTLRKVEYVYDHQGRMVWKKISRGGAEAQSWEAEKSIAYLWDAYNIIAESIHHSSFSNHNFYIWGLDLDGTLQGAGGVGGLLAVVKDSATYIPAWDANGNIIEYSADDGTIVAHREYDPFGGTVVVEGEANAFTHWFSTKPWCVVTGLSEYQYRKYSPAMGRWVSRDPSEEEGGINMLVAFGNEPLSKYDYFGLSSLCDCVKVSTVVYYRCNYSSLLFAEYIPNVVPTTPNGTKNPYPNAKKHNHHKDRISYVSVIVERVNSPDCDCLDGWPYVTISDGQNTKTESPWRTAATFGGWGWTSEVTSFLDTREPSGSVKTFSYSVYMSSFTDAPNETCAANSFSVSY